MAASSSLLQTFRSSRGRSRFSKALPSVPPTPLDPLGTDLIPVAALSPLPAINSSDPLLYEIPQSASPISSVAFSISPPPSSQLLDQPLPSLPLNTMNVRRRPVASNSSQQGSPQIAQDSQHPQRTSQPTQTQPPLRQDEETSQARPAGQTHDPAQPITVRRVLPLNEPPNSESSPINSSLSVFSAYSRSSGESLIRSDPGESSLSLGSKRTTASASSSSAEPSPSPSVDRLSNSCPSGPKGELAPLMTRSAMAHSDIPTAMSTFSQVEMGAQIQSTSVRSPNHSSPAEVTSTPADSSPSRRRGPLEVKRHLDASKLHIANGDESTTSSEAATTPIDSPDTLVHRSSLYPQPLRIVSPQKQSASPPKASSTSSASNLTVHSPLPRPGRDKPPVDESMVAAASGAAIKLRQTSGEHKTTEKKSSISVPAPARVETITSSPIGLPRPDQAASAVANNLRQATGQHKGSEKIANISSPATARAQVLPHSPIRLPTPEYEKQDVLTPIVDAFVSPISPASSPDPLRAMAKRSAPSALKSSSNTSSTTTTTLGPGAQVTLEKCLPLRTSSLESSSPLRSNLTEPTTPSHNASRERSTSQGSSQVMHTPLPFPPRTSSSGWGGGALPLRSADRESFTERHPAPLESPNLNTITFPRTTIELAAPGTVFKPNPLRQTHFTCYQHHRKMDRLVNQLYPLMCQVCDRADNEDRWKCQWCNLRICELCLRQFNGHQRDLGRLVEQIRGPAGMVGLATVPE